MMTRTSIAAAKGVKVIGAGRPERLDRGRKIPWHILGRQGVRVIDAGRLERLDRRRTIRRQNFGGHMLSPKNQQARSDENIDIGGGGRGGGSGGNDGADTAESSAVRFDGTSYFNVTVSLQSAKVSSPASQRAMGAHSTGTTSQSVGSPSLGPRSCGSVSSTVASQTPSLAESIGNFDLDKYEERAKATLAGSGLLSGDVSAALPVSIERAEEVLRHTQETLARADGHIGGSNRRSGGDCEGGLSTEELEKLSGALKRALFVCPNHKGLHAMRGEVHRRLQDFRTAVGSLRLAVRMDKTALDMRQRLAEVLLSQGMVWIDSEDNEAALLCFEEACTIDGANACVHFCKAVALVKLTRFGEALRAIEAVLGRRKGTVDDYVLRAKIRWALGMVGPGNDDMEAARRLRSDHPEVLMFRRRCLADAEYMYGKAKAFADAGDDQTAIKLLNQVAGFTPEDVKVPFLRAASKRRLKDFVGALRDYDECSFRHFQGVHVGRRALHQAVDQIRSMRGEGRDTREAGGGGGADEEEEGEEGEWLGGGVIGAVVEGEVTIPGVMSSTSAGDGNPVRDAHSAEINFSRFGDRKPRVFGDGRDDDRSEDNTDDDGRDGGGGQRRNSGSQTACATEEGAGHGKEVGTRDGMGREGSTGVPVETKNSSSPVLPERDGGSGGVSGAGGKDRLGTPEAVEVIDTKKLAEDVEAQAVDERGAEDELRWRFRLAIPHAGLDPAYALRRSSLTDFLQQQQQQQQRERDQQDQDQQQENLPCGQRSSVLSLPPLTHRSGVSSSEVEGLLTEVGREGGEGRDKDMQQEECYTEPSYITRQRCLVLNDWALNFFEYGEYAKAVSALDLAIAGDQVFASVTGGTMESKFFLNRGDCYRSGGAAEMAVRDYKRALEVEPANWMVSTRLSLAHYLKGTSLFNDGDFLGAKNEVNTAIAYNWKVPTYYILRGHTQYFGGWVSAAHVDYKKALQLDPGNKEAQRLCRQFDSQGKLAAQIVSKNERGLPATSRPSQLDTKGRISPLPPSSSLPPQPSPRSSASPSSSSSWLSPVAPPPPSRTSPRRQGLLSTTISTSGRSTTTMSTCSETCSIFTATSAASGRAPAASTSRCRHCGSVAADLRTLQPCGTDSPSVGRAVTDGTIPRGGGCSWKRKQKQHLMRRGRDDCLLPKLKSRPSKSPEWRRDALAWVKSGEIGVKRVFKERVGGVPARNERLWGMMRPSPRKSWTAVGAAPKVAPAAAGRGKGAGAAEGAAGGERSVTSSGYVSLLGSTTLAAEAARDGISSSGG